MFGCTTVTLYDFKLQATVISPLCLLRHHQRCSLFIDDFLFLELFAQKWCMPDTCIIRDKSNVPWYL